jgi:hypothetical protein
MSTPSEVIYLKQMQAEKRSLDPPPEKRDYSIEDVKAMPKDDKARLLSQTMKFKPTTFQHKLLLMQADITESEMRSLKQSADEQAKSYLLKLMETTQLLSKPQRQKHLLNMDC